MNDVKIQTAGNKSQATGHNAETDALYYLEQQNLRLLQRNFHSRFGEIDLIMQDKCDDTVVFVEVRQRKTGIADALTSISMAKQKKLIKAAQYYLLKCGHDIACRFDAVAIGADNQQIEWLKNIIIL